MELNIGMFKIHVPDGHELPEIYRNIVTYDFMPWKIIKRLLVDNEIVLSTLVDVGGNIGDTVAHFRNFSKADVLSIEADSKFFLILEQNTRQFKNITTVNKLVCPSHLVGKVTFRSGLQTGSTSIGCSPNTMWTGEIITLDEIFDSFHGEFIFKTDTDGFDAEIISDLIRIIKIEERFPPIIFYEGASESQIEANDFSLFVEVTTKLQEIGYEILLLTNSGFPYAYAGKLKEAIQVAFDGLAMGYRVGRAPCHYFDIIAVRDNLDTSAIRSGFSFLEDPFQI